MKWKMNKKLNLVIDICDYKWYNTHKADIRKWLDSEGILEMNEHNIQIWLYTDEQMSYFKLKWG